MRLNENDLLIQESKTWGDSDNKKGEVFTNPEIVSFMIMSSGIVDALIKPQTKILEPCCGQGEFVIAIADILCRKLKERYGTVDVFSLIHKVKAIDISPKNVEIAKGNTLSILLKYMGRSEAETIVSHWFKVDDFLLWQSEDKFSHIVGNPPYVRIENIPKRLLGAYRVSFMTMIERADLYIAFFEKGLKLLAGNGTLSFICTDRWTKNRYGSALRAFIAKSFNLDMYIDLYGQDSFYSSVLTYPAITQISKTTAKNTLILHNPSISKDLGRQVYNALIGISTELPKALYRKDIINGEKPWLFGAADELELISRLEKNFPPLEEVGCKVYIGAATGNNKIYIVDQSLNVEPSRKIPTITAADIVGNTLIDKKKYIINTYDENGVICLDNYPLLKEYLDTHADALKKRHIAKSNPQRWFKTIDRVYPERAQSSKLLIPDIKSAFTVIYDDGYFHPNNSIYYICSNSWNLFALKAVLLSGIGLLFIQAYSTKVAGGHLRFQAQHLRRIRIPYWHDVEENLKNALAIAGKDNNVEESRQLICQLFDLTEKDKQMLSV